MGYKQQNHTTWHKDDEIFNSKKINRTLKQTEMEAEWAHISKGLIITLQQNCPFTSCLPWPKARVGKGKKSHSKTGKEWELPQKMQCSKLLSPLGRCLTWTDKDCGQEQSRASVTMEWGHKNLRQAAFCTWRLPQHRFPSLQLKLAVSATAFYICLASFCVLTLNTISTTHVIRVSPAGQDNVESISKTGPATAAARCEASCATDLPFLIHIQIRRT